MTKQELLQLKEEIERLEHQVSKDEGALAQMMSDLKESGFDSIAQAEKAVREMDLEIEKIQEELDEKVRKIEAMMEETRRDA